jgi:fatty-acid peroxygenase
MGSIPRFQGFDSSLALFTEGYLFGSTRFERLGTDIFRTRLRFQPATFMYGEEAAREFYEPGRMSRKFALPLTALKLLLDEGSVNMLDGEAHGHRKQMFMSLMAPESIGELAATMASEWRARLPRWERRRHVVLAEEVREVLTRAVCSWAGLPLTDREAHDRTGEFSAMIDGAGSAGPRNWWGLLLRSGAEQWAREMIVKIRSGALRVPSHTPVHVIATHRDLEGRLLDVPVAAVELINVLRPTVAVARFITFAAHALEQHAEWAPRVAEDDEALEWFVQEVRRFYPFFPAVGGRVRERFEWRGHRFDEGAWVLLDLYATNRDARTWEEPAAFRPERFAAWDGSPFGFVPQGGGEFDVGHRCAGEWITIELMKTAVRLLTTSMRYEVPPQDLTVPLRRMPSMPRSRFVIEGIERVAG